MDMRDYFGMLVVAEKVENGRATFVEQPVHELLQAIRNTLFASARLAALHCSYIVTIELNGFDVLWSYSLRRNSANENGSRPSFSHPYANMLDQHTN